jgi:hypothetical protein
LHFEFTSSVYHINFLNFSTKALNSLHSFLFILAAAPEFELYCCKRNSNISTTEKNFNKCRSLQHKGIQILHFEIQKLNPFLLQVTSNDPYILSII